MSRPRSGGVRGPLAVALVVASVALAGCASGASDHAPARIPTAPWSGPALTAEEAPAPLLTAWEAAENRRSCAPLAPTYVFDEATPRRATFGGGWGVAWDLPGLRSAFGVAGTGVSASASTYEEWPYGLRWADGSIAGYGPEGGTGPNQLAYLRVPGEGCLYNVWSRLGVEHLEELLTSLRRVEP